MIINTPIEVISLDVESELWVCVAGLLIYIKRCPDKISVSLYRVGEECTELESFVYPLENLGGE